MYACVCVCVCVCVCAYVYPIRKYISPKIRTIPSCYCYLNFVPSRT